MEKKEINADFYKVNNLFNFFLFFLMQEDTGVRENAFQSSLIRTIKNLLPGCIVLKLDPNYIQGIPDLLILHGITWAALEVKKSEKASRRPNQEFYVKKMSKMSYATFVYPENVQQVLSDIVSWFDYVNNKELSVDEFNEIKQQQFNLQMLMQNHPYSVATA